MEKEILKKALGNLEKKVRQEHFSKGLPICYMTEDRWIVYEYPDGRIEKLKKI
jgi:hypothetical protein